MFTSPVGYGEFLRWQIATTTLKPGDLISTYTDIPDIPIRPKEGDAHPLGALPIGQYLPADTPAIIYD